MAKITIPGRNSPTRHTIEAGERGLDLHVVDDTLGRKLEVPYTGLERAAATVERLPEDHPLRRDVEQTYNSFVEAIEKTGAHLENISHDPTKPGPAKLLLRRKAAEDVAQRLVQAADDAIRRAQDRIAREESNLFSKRIGPASEAAIFHYAERINSGDVMPTSIVDNGTETEAGVLADLMTRYRSLVNPDFRMEPGEVTKALDKHFAPGALERVEAERKVVKALTDAALAVKSQVDQIAPRELVDTVRAMTVEEE